jgi:hypothetical protein
VGLVQGDGPHLRIEVVGIEEVEEPELQPASTGGKTIQSFRQKRVSESVSAATAVDQDRVGHVEDDLSGFEYDRLAERMYELGTERAVSLTVVGVFGAVVFFGLGAASLRWGNPGDLRAALQMVLPPTGYVLGLVILKSRLPRMKRRKAKGQD